MYDFLLVINTNLPSILHCFRDTALEMSEMAIFATPIAFKPPTEGLPWDDVRTIFRGCQWMASVPNGVEKLPKSFNRLSRVHQRYRRQTDDRRTGDSI